MARMDTAVDGRRLVFIGGLHGSGASRLESVLALHPSVSVLTFSGSARPDGETLQDVLGTAREHGGHDRWGNSAEMHMTESSPLCTEETAVELSQAWSSHWDLSRDLLVERSATNLTRSRLLQALFPGAAFIMVIRHPAAIVEVNRHRSAVGRSAYLRHWAAVHDTMLADLSHLERSLVIRYEDLLADTATEYERVLHFLDLPLVSLGSYLGGSGNDSSYRAFSAPLTRLATSRAVRQLAPQVKHLGYSFESPFVRPAAGQRDRFERVRHSQLPTTGIPLARLAAVRAPTGRLPVGKGALVALPGVEPATRGGIMRQALADWDTLAKPLVQLAPARTEPPAAATGSEEVNSGELRRAARGGTAAAVGILLSAVLQYVFVVVASHTLTQTAVGALLEAIAVFTICSLTFGADLGLLRFVPILTKRRPADLGRLHAVALVPAALGSTLLAVIVFIYAPQLVHVFFRRARPGETLTSLRIIACFLPAATLSAVLCASVRTWSMRASVLTQSFLQAIGRLAIIVACVAVGVTLQLASIAYAAPIAASVAVAGALVWIKVRTVPRSAGHRTPFGRIAGQFWRFSILGMFGMVFVSVITSLDVLLVGAFLSTRSAAAYSVASRYLVCGTFAVQAVIQSISRQMSSLMDARDYRAANDVYKSSTWWTMAVAWPPLIVLAVFAPLFLSVFGHGYLVAVSALAILSLSMLANTGTGGNSVLLQMAGRSGVALSMLAAGAGINVGLDVWLIPRYGIDGAAIGWTATIFEMALVTNFILWRWYRIHPFGKGYWIVGGAAVVCFGAVGLVFRLVFGTGVATFAVFAVVSCALYGTVLFKNRDTLHLDAFGSLYGKVFQLLHKATGPA